MKTFIKEFYNRIGLKTGSFFQVIQVLSIITGSIAGVPALLAQFQSDLGIVLPAWVLVTASKTVAVSAAVAWIIAKLPVKPPVTYTDQIKLEQKLPYTDKKEGIR